MLGERNICARGSGDFKVAKFPDFRAFGRGWVFRLVQGVFMSLGGFLDFAFG